jgi:hypothetical protein
VRDGSDVIINGYYAAVLEAPEGWGFTTTALPKDWGSATSLTYKIYWIVNGDATPTTGDTNIFVIGARGWNAGQAISTPPCSSTCSITTIAPEKNKLQITTVTIPNGEIFSLAESQLLQVWFGRPSESTMDIPVYVYGLQITANVLVEPVS